MRPPAYTRLQVDERRRQLLDRAMELFATHGYDELSMAKIARESGVSKPLLYHYFPNKRKLFEAVLAAGTEQAIQRLETDPNLSGYEQLEVSLDSYLDWIASAPKAYEKLMRSAGIPEVREVIDGVREMTAQRVLRGLTPDGPPPRVRAAVRSWLWYMDGVCLDWVREGDLTQDDVKGLLLGTLIGALHAAGFDPAPLLAESSRAAVES